jgi:hypothetical protein
MEVGEWLAVEAYRAERGAGLQSVNESKRRGAARDYQKYRDTAEKLTTENPRLRRVPRHQLAKAVQAELSKTQIPPSVRTIERAFGSKNKV